MSVLVSPGMKFPPQRDTEIVSVESETEGEDFVIISDNEIPEHRREIPRKLKGHKQIYELYETILHSKFTVEE